MTGAALETKPPGRNADAVIPILGHSHPPSRHTPSQCGPSTFAYALWLRLHLHLHL